MAATPCSPWRFRGWRRPWPRPSASEPPEPSLAETERLAGLAETHGTLSWATGYIDHTAVAAAVTGHGDSGTGRLIRALADIYEGELPEVSEACARDLDSIIAGAPRSVIGAVELDAKTGRAHSRWVTEIADHGLITTLQRLRGHIPAAVDGGVAHLGIGLDMAELVPVLQALVERFRAAEWECPELRELQEQTDPQQLAGLGMFTAMLADVRGMNATLLEVPGGEGMPPAVVDVATGRPQSLWQVAQGFLGATSQPEMGGGPVPLAHPMLPDGALRVALREGRFTILAGEGTSLPEVTDADLSPNGVLSLRYNLAELGEGLPDESAALAAGAGEGMPDAEELEEIREQLRAVNVDQTIDLDIGEHGIRLDVTATPGSER
ncbi:MAG: hypothetical protein U5L11_13140 [Arhodomonas sp.]|nr:hypothetical protein [Arhodomonas sp.]